MTVEGQFPKIDGDAIYPSELIGMSPTGIVVAWLKSYTNTPALPEGWVECNGQTLSDELSLLNGQTIPDLNASAGTARFLRGSATSGGTGGTETHTHIFTIPQVAKLSGASSNDCAQDGNITSSSTSTLPSYYEVVWIIRVR